MELEERRVVCKVCCTQYARYICPRCNISYCSLPCYKQHSSSCTEAFFRDQAVNQLKGTRANSQQRTAVLGALRRAAQQAAAEDDPQGLAHASLHLAAGGYPPASSLSPGGSGGPAPESSSECSSSDEEHSSGGSSAGDSSGSNSRGGPGAPRVGAGWAGVRSRGRRGGLSKATWDLLARKAAALQEGEVLEVLPEDLSPAELRAFERGLAAGALSHLLTPWQPWWLSPDAATCQLSSTGQARVQVLGPAATPTHGLVASSTGTSSGGGVGRDEDGDDGVAGDSGGAQGGAEGGGEGGGPAPLPPAPETPLPPLSSLTRGPPSPLLRWQLLELLFAYCWVQRRFNGEPGAADTAEEAAQAVLCLCPALAGLVAPASNAGHASQRSPASHTVTALSSQGQGPAGVPPVDASGAELREAGVGRAEQVGPALPMTGTTPLQPAAPAAAAVSGGRPHEDKHTAAGHPPAALAAAALVATTAPQGSGGSAPAVPTAAVAQRAARPKQLPGMALASSASDALLACLARACSAPLGDPTHRAAAVAVVGDVTAVLQAGGSAVLLALTDLRQVLLCAQAILHDPGNAASSQRVRRQYEQRLEAAVRKLWFFMVWANAMRLGTGEASVAEGWGSRQSCTPGGAAPAHDSVQALQATHHDHDLFKRELAGLARHEWEQHRATLPQQDAAAKRLQGLQLK